MDRSHWKKALVVVAAIAGAAVIAWCLFVVVALVILFGFGGAQIG